MPAFFFTEIRNSISVLAVKEFSFVQVTCRYLYLPPIMGQAPSYILLICFLIYSFKKIFEADNIAKHIDSKSLNKLSKITLTVRGIGEF